MSKHAFRTTITAVLFAILFSVAGTAAAADFTSRESSAAAIGFGFDLGQVWTWLTSAWTNLEKTFAQDTSDGGTGSAPTAQTCTNPDGCGDAGWGIDPNG
jgi:hypothetical protein